MGFPRAALEDGERGDKGPTPLPKVDVLGLGMAPEEGDRGEVIAGECDVCAGRPRPSAAPTPFVLLGVAASGLLNPPTPRSATFGDGSNGRPTVRPLFPPIGTAWLDGGGSC